MNDTPGWAAPGPEHSDNRDREGGEPRGAEGDDPGASPSKWSKEQPPAGRWSAPGSTGSTPSGSGDGWGGRRTRAESGGRTPPPGGGWSGGGWSAPPVAAKPGVIPLRPLGVGEILDGAVSTLRTHWRTVLGISLMIAVATQVVLILLERFVLRGSVDVAALEDPSASTDELLSAMGGALLESGLVLIVSLLGTIVATALLTMVTSRAVLGEPVSLSDAWRDARPQLPRLAGLTLLLPLIAIALVTVAMVPGVLLSLASGSDGAAALVALGALGGAFVAVWLTIRFSLASAALMLEKQGVVKAMARSAKLVRGSWWRVFGIQLLAQLLMVIVSSIILLPFSRVAAIITGESAASALDEMVVSNFGWTYLIITGIGSVIGAMLTLPIVAGVTVLLYIDQRIRREALDLELARATDARRPDGLPPSTPGS
ncbi:MULTISPECIES: hypothetical protein [Streptomyces]|uniref:Integral membrane protein n=1 Tax=Streptomyces griseus TaxID=1911 RepID=A0A380MSN9_STRGR|nr:hypothetical protein [Streptomyces griseus]NEE61235.1 hypothetical protein [Streptomyces sp. SID8455]SUO94357.1 Integral membrane protein [Streptomyces griseus]